MNEMITSYLNNMTPGFFIRQTAVIAVLFLLGFLTVLAVNERGISLFEILLSFPVGISVYSLTVFLLLLLHVQLTTMNVTGLLAAMAAVLLFYMLVKKRRIVGMIGGKLLAVSLITMLCIAVISTSGLLPVSISNDSLYYYSMYPAALVHFGEFRIQFNVFLTDVGQTSAMLNTLPSLYGFDEGFGIHWFLNINTLLIFIFALKERIGSKKGRTAVIIMTGVLITSMPYLIMSKWAMSNGYFMCYMFICVYSAWRYSKAPDNGSLVIQGILFAMMAFLRMEGCIVALILVLCISTLRRYTNRQLFMTFILPVFIFSILYDLTIFYVMKLYAPYTFLTKSKALIQLAALAAVGLYLLFIRGAVSDRIAEFIRVLIPVGLILVNVLLFLYNRTLYVENMKAFIANLSNQSGWGLFPMLIIGVYIMCAIITAGSKQREGMPAINKEVSSDKDGKTEPLSGDEDHDKSADSVSEILGYEDLCFIAYLLTALAVSFARDDALRESIGDSGNRVLLQGTLIAFYAACVHIIELLKCNDGR